MDPRLKNTPYRIAQYWRFKTDTEQISDTLIILGVEEDPNQGIVCYVQIQFDPPFKISSNSTSTGEPMWITAEALDQSVVELVDEKGPLPFWYGTLGEFQLSAVEFASDQPYRIASDRTAGELGAELKLKYERIREDELNREPRKDPVPEEMGLWSLISYDRADEMRNRLEKNRSLATSALPFDESDEYCMYLDEETKDCTPMMFAADSGSIEVAKVLFEYGVDANYRNTSGDTALHFAARSSNLSPELEQTARLICEKGADPGAINNAGQTPLWAGYCSNQVATVLIEFGAKPTLNHALRIGTDELTEWARQELTNNPDAVADAPFPEYVFDDLERLAQRHVEKCCEGKVSLGYSYDEDEQAVIQRWREYAEFERKAFDDVRDLFDLALQRGADIKKTNVLFYAVQWYDTSLSQWLLENGANPNLDLERGTAHYMPSIARTRKMINLLLKFGAKENPYEEEVDLTTEKWDKKAKRLLELFD